MPMYDLLEFGENYSTTSGCVRNYYTDETDDVDDDASDGMSFRFKTKTTGKTPAQPE